MMKYMERKLEEIVLVQVLSPKLKYLCLSVFHSLLHSTKNAFVDFVQVQVKSEETYSTIKYNTIQTNKTVV